MIMMDPNNITAETTFGVTPTQESSAGNQVACIIECSLMISASVVYLAKYNALMKTAYIHLLILGSICTHPEISVCDIFCRPVGYYTSAYHKDVNSWKTYKRPGEKIWPGAWGYGNAASLTHPRVWRLLEGCIDDQKFWLFVWCSCVFCAPRSVFRLSDVFALVFNWCTV